MQWAGALRRELSARNQQIARMTGSLHELTAVEIPSVIFGCDGSGHHGNFDPASYRNICANPEWARRLAKVHTGSCRTSPPAAWRWRELDCANSSDALLMNIFCHTRTIRNVALSSMLGVAFGQIPQFGFRPAIPLRSGKTDRTEMDMKVGDLLVEAKLTETGFQTAPARMIERYRDLAEVFEPENLMMSRRCRFRLSANSWRARCPCYRRVILRSVRRKAPGSYRAVVFGHPSSQKVRSALPAAITDMAGTDHGVAQVSAEIPGGEVRYHNLNSSLRPVDEFY